MIRHGAGNAFKANTNELSALVPILRVYDISMMVLPREEREWSHTKYTELVISGLVSCALYSTLLAASSDGSRACI